MRKTLADLVEADALGRIKGIMYVVDCTRDGHKAGISGSYRDLPMEATEAAQWAFGTLHSYVARKQINPMTATDFMGG